ncbi:MAG: hypothetical protein EOM20_02075 [Spartobacteria bacterium]|nr:hypothetical protein [Spartobacteria bacterium]
MNVRVFFCFACVCLACVLSVGADPVTELDYQGKVLISDLPFTGPGYFKVAIADELSTTNYWSNDGSVSLEPASSITGSVYNGVFSFTLGDATMNPIDKDIFNNGNDLYLRVWFSTDDVTFNEMLPSQKLVSSPYAINADLLDGFDAADLVSAATNSVTLGGDVRGPAHNNRIIDLQGIHVGAQAPASGEVLTFNGAAWTNAATVFVEQDPIYTNDLANGVLATGSPVYVESDPVWTADYAAGLDLSTMTNAPAAWTVDTGATNLSVSGVVTGMYDETSRTMILGSDMSDYSTGTPVYVESDPVWTNNQAVGFTMGGDIDMAYNAIHNGRYFGDGHGLTNLPVELDCIVWVATNGKLNARGTVDDPLPDPQSGYDLAALKYTNGPSTVVICSGNYGGLNMNKGSVHVLGFGRPQLGLLQVAGGAKNISGKQRVENIVVLGLAIVAADLGSDVKFHNSRFAGALHIFGPRVEVQDCYAEAMDGNGLVVGDGINNIQSIAIYNSSIFNNSATMAALQVNLGVTPFELTYCEVANIGGYAAIEDAEPGPIMPVHLYTHNYIKGPEAGMGLSAVVDPLAGGTGPTICFVQNTVQGDVGTSGHAQFYANNIVYGTINNMGGPGPGWTQAGMGTGADAANNTEHQGTFPMLPNSWFD